ncbi:MAG: hypothetical protein JWO56_2851 [Acidobacteria bacterium]|nr:hypothetical protein [Acidobacteriota bacterium]
MFPRFFVAAYASAPFSPVGDRSLQTELLSELRRHDSVRGLEHPYVGPPSAEDVGWLAGQMRFDWELVLTSIPGVMQRLAQMPAFGLASVDEQWRSEALRFMEGMRDTIEVLNAALGRQAVVAVQIHSAPSMVAPGAHGSADAFARSLSELALWDWRGASLVVEHCDSFRDGVEPQKGFLSIDDELAALERSGSTALGMTLNWGRSGIEGHSVDRPAEHARAAGTRLRGLMFSGAVGNGASRYGAWRDTHAPLGPSAGARFVEPDSLLTEETVQRFVDAADLGAVSYVGVKLQEIDPLAGIERRIGINTDAIAVIARCLARAAR